MTVKIIFSRREITVAAAMIALCVSLLAPVGPVISAEPNEKEMIALSLANLLRAARSVISDNQDLINDHTQGFKGLTSDMVILTAKEYYEIATGLDIDDVEKDSKHGQLLHAEIKAINEVIDEVQERINRKGVGFKGILPSIFAASVAMKFREKVGDRAQLRITAPKAYLRNPANGPDKWEDGMIENRLKSPGHPKGMHISGRRYVAGKAVYNLMLPEYYRESCLQCHGKPKGTRDITGRKKEGANLGDLGGVISVLIFDE